MGSTSAPDWRIKVAGSTYDHVANAVVVDEWLPFSSRSAPALSWRMLGVGTTSDPFSGKIVELQADTGSGYATVFKGRCEIGPQWSFGQEGWVRAYQAYGLRAEGDHVPVTSPIDGTDAIRFNLSPDDPDYLSSLAGMTTGNMLRYVLDSPTNATNLNALGIGGYGVIPSRAAAAHATVSAGVVTVVIDDGGAGYGSPAPTVILLGGGGTYSSATATVTTGAVSAISVSGSSGYTSAPEVWISALPSATLTDLSGLTTPLPFPVTIQGEKLLSALSSTLQAYHPNHWLHVAADGTIRIYDVRSASNTTITINSTTPSDPKVDISTLRIGRSVNNCYQRVVLRGGPDASAVFVSTADSSLTESFGHDGLTNTQAKDGWSLQDFNEPGNPSGIATGTAALSGGGLGSITVNSKGYGYTGGGSLTITGGGGSGATATFSVSGGQVSGTSVTAAGSGYTSAPTITFPAPPNVGLDTGTCTCPDSLTVTVTSADATKTWAANYWSQASGRRGVIYLTYTSGSGIDVKFCTRILSHGSLSAAGTCALTVETPLPATNYNAYRIEATAGGAADVWRKYTVASAYQGKLLTRFPFPVPMRWSSGQAATMTSCPTGTIVSATNVEAPCAVDVDPTNGIVRFIKPVVTMFGTTSNLQKGGAATDGIPSEVRAFLAVNRGNLTSTKPADSGGSPTYTGTSNSVEGLTRTLYVTAPNWISRASQGNLDAYTQEILDSVKDATIEGSVDILGCAWTWLTTIGQAVSFSGDGWTAPWGSIADSVIEARLSFRWQNGASKYITKLVFGNHRAVSEITAHIKPLVQGQMVGGMNGAIFNNWAPSYAPPVASFDLGGGMGQGADYGTLGTGAGPQSWNPYTGGEVQKPLKNPESVAAFMNLVTPRPPEPEPPPEPENPT